MILIVEGADLVGKSTLVERVAGAHGWPVAKIRWALLGDPEIETRAMATTTIELLRAARPNLIFDRIYFSWWAYAPALGYDANYMPGLIGDFAAVADARLVLLTASDEVLAQRFARKPDLYFPLDVIQAANARFPSLLPLLPPALPALHIDTGETSPDAVFTQVEAFIAG
jgi:hypothetical protein